MATLIAFPDRNLGRADGDRRLGLGLSLLLGALLEELAGLAAPRHLRHIHAGEGHEGTGALVGGCCPHGIGLGSDKTCRRHGGIAVDCTLLQFLDHLLKAINGEIKFIPIRLDRSEMPAVLQQVLYLDVYTNGFDVVLRQMIDVINGNNIYHGEARHYENIRAHVKMLSEAVMEIDIFAVTYMEPISRYIVLVTNSEADVTWHSPTDPVILTGYHKDVKVNTIFGEETVNALAVTVQRPTTPGFPVKIKVQSKTKIDFKGIMRAKSDEMYVGVPYNFVQGN